MFLFYFIIKNNFIFLRQILENNLTNESLKKAFDRIVALPLRSAINANKLAKDSTPRANPTVRPEKTLTSYEKY